MKRLPPAPVHLLHLTLEGLRWMALPGGRKEMLPPVFGAISGEPIACLEEWRTKLPVPESEGPIEAEIYLYDSRPIAFSFSSELPSGARKQVDNIVRLKIRQELGLGDDAVVSSTTIQDAAGKTGHIELFTTVVRREAFDDLAAWKEHSGLGSIWIGSDLGAIRAIFDHALLSAPCVLFTGDLKDATVYYLDASLHIFKWRAEDLRTETIATVPWRVSTPLAVFGSVEREELGVHYPALANLPSADPVRGGVKGLKSQAQSFVTAHGNDVAQAGAVLLGGLLDAGLRRPSAGSVLGAVAMPTEIGRWSRRLPLRKLAGAALASTALLMLTGLWVHHQRSSAKETLNQKARQLEPAVTRLRGQLAVLQKFQSDRVFNTPLIKAVHLAAPEETILQTLDISDNGMLQLTAVVPTDNIATSFYRALSADPQFEKVQLQNMKIDAKAKQTTFQIVAQIKGRKKEVRVRP